MAWAPRERRGWRRRSTSWPRSLTWPWRSRERGACGISIQQLFRNEFNYLRFSLTGWWGINRTNGEQIVSLLIDGGHDPSFSRPSRAGYHRPLAAQTVRRRAG